jgi:hypothetical protein
MTNLVLPSGFCDLSTRKAISKQDVGVVFSFLRKKGFEFKELWIFYAGHLC